MKKIPARSAHSRLLGVEESPGRLLHSIKHHASNPMFQHHAEHAPHLFSHPQLTTMPLLELTARLAADARRVEVRLLGLDAAQTVQLLMALLFPLR